MPRQRKDPPCEPPGLGWSNIQRPSQPQSAQNLTPDKGPVIGALILSSIGYLNRNTIRSFDDRKKCSALTIVCLLIICSTALKVNAAFFNPSKRKRQPLAYHNFADQRCWCCSIPNSNDVLSNIPFLGALYPAFTISTDLFHDERELTGWMVCFLGTAGVSLGSGYYHWKPNNKRLVWDRLPMTVSFMSIQFILLCETVGVEEIYASSPNLLTYLVLCGFSSVVYWHVFDDLTWYKSVQFVPQLLCPFLLISFTPRYTMSQFYVYGLMFYALAKVTENKDKQIYQMTGKVVSGHTLKHFCAAIALFIFYYQLVNREKI